MAPTNAQTLNQGLTLENLQRLLRNVKKKGVANFTVPFLQERLDTLSKEFHEAQATHAEILAATSEGELQTLDYFTKNTYGEIVGAFETAETFLVDHVSKLRNDSITATSSPKEGFSSIHHPSTSQFSNVKLPRFELPKFSGNYSDWSNFKDLFVSAIHDRTDLSKSQKLQYLKSCLKGEAIEVVKSFAINDANYESAWRLMCERFENKRLTKSALLNQLTSIPNVSSNAVSTLRNLRNTYSQVLLALQNLDCSVEGWDPILIHTLTQKFDNSLKRDWEEELKNEADFPTLDTFDAFLTTRIRILEAISADKSSTSSSTSNSTARETRRPRVNSLLTATKSDSCLYCHQQHRLTVCRKFLDLSPEERGKFRVGQKLCAKCLKPGHFRRDCSDKNSCKICCKDHHSLLHFGRQNSSDVANIQTNNSRIAKSSVEPKANAPSVSTHFNAFRSNEVLLATALVRVVAPNGFSTVVRALLDNGSESSFISESIAQNLRLYKRRTDASVTGIGGSSTSTVRHSVSFRIAPVGAKTVDRKVDALVLQKITSYKPKPLSSIRDIKLGDLSLADPQPYQLNRIDLLLGADLYGSVLLPGLRHLQNSKIVAQNTLFGWVLFGPTSNTRISHNVHVQHSTVEVSELLQNFWQVEQVPQAPLEKDEDQQCEEHFVETHSRDDSGRYIVRLPFKAQDSISKLGNSFPMAKASLHRLRERLVKNPELSTGYKGFLDEYLNLGHMSKVPSIDDKSQFRIYLPHHGVVREHSTTTKVRVVFNASAKTSTGVSLNDTLCPGPKLQTDITSIILNWRTFPFVYKADMEKMFRQIWLHPEERNLQCILWQDLADAKPVTYELNTVSFGMVSAPFLAMRVIKQIVLDHGSDYPLAIEPLSKLLYVDDVLFGADNLQDLAQKRSQITGILKRGGFPLAKWASNVPKLSDSSDSEQIHTFETEATTESKVLGIAWNASTDNFFVEHSASASSVVTKRTILSNIARLFDPFGWLSPVIVTAKILLQNLWIAKLDWDDSVPSNIALEWNRFHDELAALDKVSIPRWIHCRADNKQFQLVGFCDASAKAYSAAIYARVIDADGEIYAYLLMAKSKIAPLKTLSIPRLELCGAVLLTKLMIHIKTSLIVRVDAMSCYSDSKIVLAWLAKSPVSWEIFVANRVSFIQTELPDVRWSHVSTKSNPADMNSRGISSKDLLTAKLWWNGPSWLIEDPLPSNVEFPNTDVGLRKKLVTSHVVQTSKSDFIYKYSSWSRLLRVTSFLFKFAANLKKRGDKSKLHRVQSPYFLSKEILSKARNWLIRLVQGRDFATDILNLKNGKSLASNSRILNLNPFLDGDGLLRVGGRLQHSTLKFEERHPLILNRGHLSLLLIRHTHLSALHAGVQLTLQILRSQFWILNARNLVKSAIHACVVCTRHKAQLAHERMADLPPDRCSVGRAFLHVGVDYAGPFLVRSSAGRGHKTHKAYVALFVCFSTRAIHVELVSGYDTPAFVAAFHRFVSRRGYPDTIYSDNATNFRGADSELKKSFKTAVRDYSLHKELSTRSIQWKFIPPSAPHFGGLWEAGVKSLKHHLRRIIGQFTPTYEEFMTIIIRIEACLNSRPLARLHDTTDDLGALTPAHFLTGTSLLAIPEQTILDLAENRLTRWQSVSKIVQCFWKQWSGDYLQSLQSRNKWQLRQTPFKVGELVLIKDPNAPPAKWALGIVETLHPGKDNLVRVITVRTASTRLQRAVTQLCRLPVQAGP